MAAGQYVFVLCLCRCLCICAIVGQGCVGVCVCVWLSASMCVFKPTAVGAVCAAQIDGVVALREEPDRCECAHRNVVACVYVCASGWVGGCCV